MTTAAPEPTAGALVEELISTLTDPLTSEPASDHPMDALLYVLHADDLWDAVDWYHPDHHREAFIAQFFDYLRGRARARGVDSEVEVVRWIRDRVTEAYESWAGPTADEQAGRVRDWVAESLASPQGTTRLQSALSAQDPRYASMSVEEFTASMRERLHIGAATTPRSEAHVRKLEMDAEAWKVRTGSRLSDRTLEWWRARAT